MYDLARSAQVDGFVVWGAQLAHKTGIDAVRAFCRRYAPRPLVNIGPELPGIPTLLLDQRQGMAAVVTHPIETHGCRRITYLWGNEEHPESRDLYQGYLDALQQHNIPLDPALVAGWQEVEAWRQRDPEHWALIQDAGILVVLEAHTLRPGVDFDAVVGQSDVLAAAAICKLQRRGIRVPDDVAVAGFADLPPVQ